MIYKISIIFLIFYTALSCSFSPGPGFRKKKIKKEQERNNALEAPPILDTCHWDDFFVSRGLIDVQSVNPTIMVKLVYSDTDNFMHRDLYGCLKKCYLRPDIACRLDTAQHYLQRKDSSLTLLIYDGVRPRRFQQQMWDSLRMPTHEKVRFVSNPKNGSIHNFGAAVDITLADKNTGIPLDMGCPYDHIGKESWPIMERHLVEIKVLTEEQVNNRKLLRRVMAKSGFFNIQTEWWHFNGMTRVRAKEMYEMID